MNQINKEKLHTIFTNLKQSNQNFEEFYKNYYNLVYKISFCIIKNKEQAEDISQNVFIKIYNMPKEKIPTEGEASWLYTVTKNETINYIKAQKNENQLFFNKFYKKPTKIKK